MMDRLLEEKLQVLNGDRGDKTKAAVRRGDLALGAKRVPRSAGAPTAAEFNALVDAYNDLLVKLADIARK